MAVLAQWGAKMDGLAAEKELPFEKEKKILPGISVTRWIGMWCCSFSATAQMPERSSKAEGRGFNRSI
jgi:hypothetical protein